MLSDLHYIYQRGQAQMTAVSIPPQMRLYLYSTLTNILAL